MSMGFFVFDPNIENCWSCHTGIIVCGAMISSNPSQHNELLEYGWICVFSSTLYSFEKESYGK